MLQRTSIGGNIVRRLYYESAELLRLYKGATLLFDIANNQIQNWRISTSLESYTYQQYGQTGTTQQTQSRSASGSASSSSAANNAAANAVSPASGWDGTSGSSISTSPNYTEQTQGRSASGGGSSTPTAAQNAAYNAIGPASGWDGTRNRNTSTSPNYTEQTQGRSASGSANTESAASSAASSAVSPASGWDGTRNSSISTSPVTTTTSGSVTGSGANIELARSNAYARLPPGAAVHSHGTSESGNLIYHTLGYDVETTTYSWSVTWTDYRSVISSWSWSATWTDYRDVISSYSWSVTWTDYRSIAVFGYTTRTGTRTIYIAQWDALPTGTLFTQYRIERGGASDVIISNIAATSYDFRTTNYNARIRAENPALGIEGLWSEYAQN